MTAEYFQISRRLEMFHSIFQKFWEMGIPVFIDSKKNSEQAEQIPTAAIEFDREGNFMQFLFNKDFFNSLNEEQKAFTIAHEALHVILNHGKRTQNSDPILANIATDLAINHMLVKYFGFKKEKIDPNDEYCWVHKFFNDNVSDDLSYEQYYFLLKNKVTSMKNINYQLVDIHNFECSEESFNYIMGRFASELSEGAKKEIVEKLESHFLEDENSSKHKNKSGGRGQGGLGGLLEVNIKEVKKKRKWETIIKKWFKDKISTEFRTFEHWARINRRGDLLPTEIILPSEMELLDYNDEKKKITAYFFLDTSGSCEGDSQRFFNSAKSMPLEKIDVRFFSFDDRVYDVDLKKGKLYGGGGTSFDIIENKIQSDLKNKKINKYPDAVFVLTDGEGNKVFPEKPENWHWMLTYNWRYCIPKKSKIYNLEDFE